MNMWEFMAQSPYLTFFCFTILCITICGVCRMIDSMWANRCHVKVNHANALIKEFQNWKKTQND